MTPPPAPRPDTPTATGDDTPTARGPAVPAAAALLACAALTAWVLWSGAEPDVAALRTRARRAADAGEHAAAALHYRHLLALEPTQPAHAMDLATAIDRLGRRAEAMAVLNAIAPASGGGYAPAHLRQAEWIIEDRVLRGGSDPEHLALARTHATAAAESESSRAAALALLEIIGGATQR